MTAMDTVTGFPYPRPSPDLSCRAFGRLTVVRQSAPLQGSRAKWPCRCSCGNEPVVRADHLLSGASKSCGCLKRETTANRFRTHGKSHTPENKVWKAAIDRCENPRQKSYRHYGGRGITMVPEWRRSFAQFLADMGPRPSSTHSIDRIDNDGPYAPWNCRWATREQQRANQRARRPGPPKRYPPDLVERVRSVYGGGATIAEVAEALATTQKIVWRVMLHHRIARRAASRRLGRKLR